MNDCRSTIVFLLGVLWLAMFGFFFHFNAEANINIRIPLRQAIEAIESRDLVTVQENLKIVVSYIDEKGYNLREDVIERQPKDATGEWVLYMVGLNAELSAHSQNDYYIYSSELFNRTWRILKYKKVPDELLSSSYWWGSLIAIPVIMMLLIISKPEQDGMLEEYIM